MPKTRVILELGSGNDLHGSDYTKAALRAVQDALHHSSLSFIRWLQIDKTKLDVEVTIGVQRPEQVDLAAVKSSLPVGNVTVRAIKGGLDVADPENNARSLPAQPSQFASRRRHQLRPTTVSKEGADDGSDQTQYARNRRRRDRNGRSPKGVCSASRAGRSRHLVL
jgi:uncharacterized protein (TIGR02058 family)